MSGLPVDPATQAATALGWLAQACLAALLAHGLFSWVRADPAHVAVRAVAGPIAPVIARLRRLLPAALRAYPVDVAFVVALCLALCVRYGVAEALREARSRVP